MTDITPKELRSLRERISFEISRDSGPIRQELEDALRNAADQLERQAWIPCRERMPETHGAVFVIGRDAVGGRFRRIDIWSLVLGWTYNANRVTHWMPIPPLPPEGES